ncbi:MAG TPA: AraC family transcriptional regulator [Phycisphaerales bacterium]|nr:AraC family transcriptional regulator [Phycisphaerales bacterium]
MLNPGDGRTARLLRHAHAGGFRFTLKHYDATFRQPEHEHPHCVIDLVIGGYGNGRYGASHRESFPGSVEFFAARTGHTFACGPVGIRTLHMSFDPSLAPPRTPGECPTPAAGPLCRALEVLLTQDAPDPWALESLGLEALGCLAEAGAARTQRPPRWLASMREQLLHDPSPPGIGELAESHGVDPSHVARAFRTAYGESPGDTVRQARMARAIARLAKDEPPSRAAAATGYADQAHMTRAFRSTVGMTPARIRGVLARARSL